MPPSTQGKTASAQRQWSTCLDVRKNGTLLASSRSTCVMPAQGGRARAGVFASTSSRRTNFAHPTTRGLAARSLGKRDTFSMTKPRRVHLWTSTVSSSTNARERNRGRTPSHSIGSLSPSQSIKRGLSLSHHQPPHTQWTRSQTCLPSGADTEGVGANLLPPRGAASRGRMTSRILGVSLSTQEWEGPHRQKGPHLRHTLGWRLPLQNGGREPRNRKIANLHGKKPWAGIYLKLSCFRRPRVASKNLKPICLLRRGAPTAQSSTPQ